MGKERKDREYAPGERIAGTAYIVIRLEARGGHGALYLVRHHFLEKKIQMLKTLRALDPSRDLMARLQREAQTLASMHHPNIVEVIDGGITEEPEPRPFLVMERLRGRSLASIRHDTPEGVGDLVALQILIELCDALQYIHERGVIHRDVKPDNIFLERSPHGAGATTKLLDFGVVHMLAGDKRLTQERTFIGTFRYAAPELLFGDPPTPQTDLYALGLVGYEIITGHHPFEDCSTPAELGKAHLQRTPDAFPPEGGHPPELEALILEMLRKKPEERPASAEWLAIRFRRLRVELEQEEGAAVIETLYPTNPSPVQNAMTATRAERTDPGETLAAAAAAQPMGPAASEPATRAAPTRQERRGAPDRTEPDGPLPFAVTEESPEARVRPVVPAVTTVSQPRPPAPTEPAPPAVDRNAPTVTPKPVAAPARRNDTEEMPAFAGGPYPAEPASEEDVYQESPVPDSSPPRARATQEGASTSRAVAIESRRPSTTRGREVWWAVVGGVALASVGVWGYAQSLSPPDGHERPTAPTERPAFGATTPPGAPVAPVAVTAEAPTSSPHVASPSVPQAAASDPSPAKPASSAAARPASKAEPAPKGDVIRDLSDDPGKEAPKGAPPPSAAKPKLPGSGL